MTGAARNFMSVGSLTVPWEGCNKGEWGTIRVHRCLSWGDGRAALQHGHARSVTRG